MILEALFALLSGNFAWFSYIAINNLFWVFAFLALSFFFWEGKKIAKMFVVIVYLSWVFMTWPVFVGWPLFVGGFLALYYMGEIGTLLFAESDPKLRKHLPLIDQLVFFSLWAFYAMVIA